ncbi:hypothetical protein Ciccas_003511 [Cichlidogyrus casuarinus]|uniref:Myosin motor domain-containing protein n=1 Tax=Cichlidogyrus casuarinus TaxID=1844966 RepID=A0ABD2QEX6_9PLAT
MYQLSELALENLRCSPTGGRHCIILSGISGSGKTESAKLIMQHIIERAINAEKSGSIQSTLLNANVILELFVEKAASSLGTSAEFLEWNILFHKVRTGPDERRKTMFVTQCDLYQVGAKKTGLVKSLYNALFALIVEEINLSLTSNHNHDRELGILDMYGFESCELAQHFSSAQMVSLRNGFGQFCINYANENLHSLFIDRVLKDETEAMLADGIIAPVPRVISESLTVDRMNQMIAALDQVCQLRRLKPQSETDSRDTDWVASIQSLLPSQKGFSDKISFEVQHFAGTVEYSAKNFAAKSFDRPPLDFFEEIIRNQSSDSLLKRLSSSILASESLATPQKKRPVSVLSSFKATVTRLVRELREEELYFVRCLRASSQPGNGRKSEVDKELLKYQVKSNGIVEAIAVGRVSYFSRLSYQEILERYSYLLSFCPISSVRKCFNWTDQLDTELNRACEKKLKSLPDVEAVKLLFWIHNLYSLLGEKENNSRWRSDLVKMLPQVGSSSFYFQEKQWLTLQKLHRFCLDSAARSLQRGALSCVLFYQFVLS